jgi:hypothetical protein
LAKTLAQNQSNCFVVRLGVFDRMRKVGRTPSSRAGRLSEDPQ